MTRLILLFLCLININTTAHAQEDISVESWAALPILHEGRVKPLDSFARIMLKKFSGSEKIGAHSADEWLAKSLLTPETMVKEPLFKIRAPEDYGLEIKNKT